MKRLMCMTLALLALILSACSRERNEYNDTETAETDSVTTWITESVTTEPVTIEPIMTETVITEMTDTAPVQTESLHPETTVAETTAASQTTAPAVTEPIDRGTVEANETEPPVPTVQPTPTPPPISPSPTETVPPETTPPPQVQPVQTQPVPPTTEPPLTTEPIQTEPVVAEPVVPEPVVTEPVETEPAVTEPVVTEPVITEPVVTEPAVTEPPIADPSMGDFAAISPDGTKMIRFEVVSDDGTNPSGAEYRASAIDLASGSCTVTALTSLYQPEVFWSPDSRYAAVSYRRDAVDTATIVLDTVDGRELVPPHGDLSRQIFSSFYPELGGTRLYRLTSVPEAWEDGFIRIAIRGQVKEEWVEGEVGGVVGYFTFDLKTLSTVECAYLTYYNRTSLPPPDNDTEQILHDRLLLIAGDGSIRDVQTLIAKNEAAYAEIFAVAAETEDSMGTAAKIYLKEVIYTDHGTYDPSQESLYAAKEVAAAVLAALGETVK